MPPAALLMVELHILNKKNNRNTNNIINKNSNGKKNNYQKSHKISDNDKSRPSPHVPDSLDIWIINELLANADISSTAIASKHSMPLSTIQRRRAILESNSMLKHEYSLDSISLGLKEVEFWVVVEKGKAEEVAHRIFEKYKNVLLVTLQMNAGSNVRASASFDSSEQMYRTIEEMKGMPFVKQVEFGESIKVVGKRKPYYSRDR